MPRYFFDTDDGERQFRDDTGIDLASADDVAFTTRDLLFDLGHAELFNGKDRLFTATVRDKQGKIISNLGKDDFGREWPENDHSENY